MEVSNGVCIESVMKEGEDKYWFPFLVLSCLWLIFALIYKLMCRNKRKVAYLPMAIPGVAFFSFILALYEGLSLYYEK